MIIRLLSHDYFAKQKRYKKINKYAKSFYWIMKIFLYICTEFHYWFLILKYILIFLLISLTHVNINNS